jgi:acyl-CoA synthetase (AMP-forming)/AMP-acid ligase II/aryl carrier-like protein
LVLHTSGTTARPKIVPLTQGNLCASARSIAATLELSARDCCLNVMPLFHIHGLIGGLFSSLAAGASVACAPGFDVTAFFSWLEECRATWYTAVPTMHQAILSQARTNRPVLARCPLRFIRSSSAPLPPSVMRELEDALHVPVIEAYGMTEAAHQIASNPLPPCVRKPGSVGLPAGPEVAVMDAAGCLLPPGQTGEIVLRGPSLARGYAENPEANRSAFTDGWFRTGDEGFRDRDGYLFLTGRLKEIINRGGEKISPREIEEVLLEHPAVAQAVAFGVPHPTLGESAAAAVVLRAEAAASEGALRSFAAERLAEFKVPHPVLIVEEIPKGATGKLQRIGLAEKLGLHPVGSPPAPSDQWRSRGPQTAVGSKERSSVPVPCPAPPTADCRPPGTSTEVALAAIWGEVLDVEAPGIHENFLALGGDSIRAMQIISRAREALKVDLPLRAFFDTPTIAAMAASIEADLPGRSRGE